MDGQTDRTRFAYLRDAQIGYWPLYRRYC